MYLFRLLVFVSVFLRSFFPPMHTLKAAPDAHMSKFPIQTHMHLRTTKEKPCTCRRMIPDAGEAPKCLHATWPAPALSPSSFVYCSASGSISLLQTPPDVRCCGGNRIFVFWMVIAWALNVKQRYLCFQNRDGCLHMDFFSTSCEIHNSV